MSDWVIRLIDQSGYLGIGFLMFLETIFPPIPSEVIMPVAGVAAGQGKLSYARCVASGTTGAMPGNIVWYLAARALGLDRLQPIIDRCGRWLTITWPEVHARRRLVSRSMAWRSCCSAGWCRRCDPWCRSRPACCTCSSAAS